MQSTRGIRRYSNRARGQRGVTLVEMVMVTIIIGILAATIFPAMINTMEAYQITNNQLVTLSQLRYAVERMAREIREVEYTGGAYTIVTTYPSATSIQFTKNDAASTVVTIAGPPSTITLGYSAPAVTSTLTDQATALTFDYFQADGTNATSNADVASVRITLALQNPVTGFASSQRTRVFLRNQ